MTRTRLLLPLALLAAIVALLAMRACSDRTTSEDPASSITDSVPATATAAADSARDERLARIELTSQYQERMRSAVSTLHRYLAALPGEERTPADAFWVGGKPATGSDEADLRALPASPSHFRIRNRTPESLDRTPLPEAVRIPVELRLGLEGQSARRYRGWYELQHMPGDDTWQIRNASIDVIEPGQ